ncbi:MAG: T9SS type A sorting domain-containing protein [Bacteroidota bacterium]
MKLISISVLFVFSSLILSYLNNDNNENNKYNIRNQNQYSVDGAINWLNERRLNLTTQTISIEDIINAQNQVNIMSENNNLKSFNLVWEDLGPDNIGGRTRALLIDKNNPGTMYAGGVAGGLWISTTAGLSWHKVNDYFDNMAVASVCQSASGDIYFGTGEGMYHNSGDGAGGIQGKGIWKSTDGINFTHLASTWSDYSSQSAFVNVNKMAADPINPNRLYAATKKGLRNSNDGGATWYNPTTSNSISSDVKVGSDGTVIASIGNIAYISLTGDSGTFVKSPGGTNQISYYSDRLEFAIAPEDPNYIYCQAAQSGKTVVYQSTDKGLTWSKIADGFTSESFNPLGGQGTYDNTIAVFPNNKEKILLGGQFGLWKGQSYSGSWSFEQISWWSLNSSNPYYVHADQHAIVFHPTNPNILFIGSDGGISRSLDGANTFTAVNKNYTVTQFYSVGYSPNGSVVGGTQDNGSLYINPYTLSPRSAQRLTGGDGGYSAFSQINPEIAYSTLYYGTVYQNHIGHLTETIFSSSTGGSFVTPIALWENFNDSHSTDTLFFIADKDYNINDSIILFSKYQNRKIVTILDSPLNEGETLNVMDYYQGLLAVGYNGGIALSRNAGYMGAGATWYAAISSGNVGTLTISKDGNYIYYAVGSSLYRASNILDARDASSMSLITTKLIGSFSQQTITDIAVDPQNPNNVIVTLGNYGNVNYVYYSTNAATTNSSSGNFVSVQGNLPAMPVYSALINWDNSKTVILGTEYGVFSTQNIISSPVTWEVENNGMPNSPVFMVRQQIFENFFDDGNTGVQNHGFIYAATHGRGIFYSKTLRGPLAIKELNPSESSYDLSIYPNPASNYVNIDLADLTKKEVMIFIYDIKGNLIFQELKSANNNEEIKTLDIRNLATGIYFISIKSLNNTVIKKLIVI